jgi:hypothetical protein
MEANKKNWEKPQLIVLARGTPEENVLTHCKYIGYSATGVPQSVGQTGCDKSETDKNCGACQSRSGS